MNNSFKGRISVQLRLKFHQLNHDSVVSYYIINENGKFCMIHIIQDVRKSLIRVLDTFVRH